MDQALSHDPERLDHVGAGRIYRVTDIGQLQLMVAADEQLPPEEIFQLFDLLGHRSRGDAKLGGGMSTAAQPCARLEGSKGVQRR
jgi:hypothetical protein